MESDSYIFNSEALRRLLAKKFVVFIGDSVVRSMYKDSLLLLQDDRMLSSSELKRKGEFSFLGDELIEGGMRGEMSNGKNYTEVRQYCESSYLLRFYFVTRVYSPYMETIIADLVTGPRPDIVVINSCLWDITRYGAQSMVQYEMNIQKLCQQLKRLLMPETLVIWLTAMPVAQTVRGGFLVDEISFISEVLRVDILLANYYSSQVVSDHGFDVIDLHYAFRRQTNNRADDGIHWNSVIHRAITNMLLWHVCGAWHVVLPASNSRLREPPQRQNSNGFDSGSRFDGPVQSCNSYSRRSRPQQTRRQMPHQRNVDFLSDNFADMHNDLVGFGRHLQQIVTNRDGVREFGNDLTNRGQPRHMARRGRRGGRQSYRHRPY